MCGRFALRSGHSELQRLFQADFSRFDEAPRYNIAPTQPVLAVAEREGRRLVASLRWGLVPPWADNAAIGSRMINARAETVAEKAAFREAFRRRRCLIPADGFYEWVKDSGEKRPYYIHMKREEPFAFAGLWEMNQKTGESLSTCAILTTEANSLMGALHERMPVILSPEDQSLWLDPDAPPEALRSLLRPYPGEAMEAFRVSPQMNSPRFDGPECIEPVADEPPKQRPGDSESVA